MDDGDASGHRLFLQPVLLRCDQIGSSITSHALPEISQKMV